MRLLNSKPDPTRRGRVREGELEPGIRQLVREIRREVASDGWKVTVDRVGDKLGIEFSNPLSPGRVGLGLGAQAGEARLRAVFEEAGFNRFRKASETPLNLILEARP